MFKKPDPGVLPLCRTSVSTALERYLRAVPTEYFGALAAMLFLKLARPPPHADGGRRNSNRPVQRRSASYFPSEVRNRIAAKQIKWFSAMAAAPAGP